jgi:phosphoribosyl-dephospho-CoA transferase
MRESPPAVHALLRVIDIGGLVWEAGRPDWAGDSLHRAPWVVVRRRPGRPGVSAVGVRGMHRAQRSAAWVPDGAVALCVTPQLLAEQRSWLKYPPDMAHPAVMVLQDAARILDGHGHAGEWGPAGSVGFELASGTRCTTAASDLDLVLRSDRFISRPEAARLQADLEKLPVRIDLLLETAHGAVAFSEYASDNAVMLLRSAEGTRLVSDPWTDPSAARSA